MNPSVEYNLAEGAVIPAMPLALNANRQFDERRQAALIRYYLASGAGGLAVGVHTTQFQIRDPKHGLYEPVLRFAMDMLAEGHRDGLIRVAGICGPTLQALHEAEVASSIGYDLGLLSLGGFGSDDLEAMLEHCREVGKIIPLFGFYLQPAVVGIELPYSFWREFAEIDSVKAIKIAAFNRYQTLDVVRAVCESSRRDEIALYTGNDDNIVVDLLTPYRFHHQGGIVEKRIVGGLLGHWAVWTNKAVEIFEEIKAFNDGTIPRGLLTLNQEVTDCNAVIFDAANQFQGCIPGIHEILRRQGLLEGTWCLDPGEQLSPGQAEEIDRIYQSYPHLNDDAFVAEHLDTWLG
ncbi:MAG: dihydrodipicolinate synthase family protein [Candidatus Omnitrophica bacterium]|nr:dihydrodipicolinate synthase family protein [Candidatus Omnitrophota bacterium]